MHRCVRTWSHGNTSVIPTTSENFVSSQIQKSSIQQSISTYKNNEHSFTTAKYTHWSYQPTTLAVNMSTQYTHITHSAQHTMHIYTTNIAIIGVTGEIRIVCKTCKNIDDGQFLPPSQVSTEKMKQFTNWHVSWTLRPEVMGLKLRKKCQ